MQTLYSYYTCNYSHSDLTSSPPHHVEFIDDNGDLFLWDVHAQRRVETFASRQEMDAAIEAVKAEARERQEFLDRLDRTEGGVQRDLQQRPQSRRPRSRRGHP